MTNYPYEMQLVVDPTNPRNIVAGGSVSIYDSADTGKTTLLALTDPNGVPIANPITSNANGFTEPFVTTSPQVLWVSGEYVDYFNSFIGLRDEAVAAKTEAQTAKTAAESAAATTVTTATVNGSGRLILTRADTTTIDAGVVAGPQGLPGAPGVNGSNVLPTDTAIKDAIANPVSATRIELDGQFAASATFKRIIAGGSNTTGDNIRVGNFAYGPTTVGTTYVQGGSNSYENVIGGNTANVNTPTSNLTGAAALVAPNGNWSAILHGYDNVNNGWANIVSGFHCYAVSGSNHGTIAGGSDQKITGTDVAYSTISGGTNNLISATGGTISGGYSHTVTGTQGTVAGGLSNDATGSISTVGGGQNNTASGSNSSVAGGSGNTASGAQATVGGGLNNSATNLTATVAGGSGSSASNQYASVGGGLTTVASGIGATVPGGRENTALGNYSVTTGRGAATTMEGQRSHASGVFAVQGDAQLSEFVARNTSTDAVAKELYLQGTGSRLTLPDDSTWFFEINVVARRTDVDGESAAYKYTGCVDRGATASTTAFVGTVVETVVAEDNAAWGVAVTVGTSDGTLRVTATGEAAKNIRWVAYTRIVSVTG